MSVWDEIELLPVACVDPFEDGTPVILRLGLRHRREGCDWQVNYESEPSSAIAWPRIDADVWDHMRRCPLRVRRERKDADVVA